MKLELSNKIIIRTTSEGIVYVHGIKLSEIIESCFRENGQSLDRDNTIKDKTFLLDSLSIIDRNE